LTVELELAAIFSGGGFPERVPFYAYEEDRNI